jgi:hypothetical protein
VTLAARSERHVGPGVRDAATAPAPLVAGELHPSWRSFISFCAMLEHGELEGLKIQNGLPVLAEVTRKKVKFD